jgi:hypothetical protein
MITPRMLREHGVFDAFVCEFGRRLTSENELTGTRDDGDSLGEGI